MTLFLSPPSFTFQVHTDPAQAVDALTALYQRNTLFIQDQFKAFVLNGQPPLHKVRAYYPYIKIQTDGPLNFDSRLAYGHFSEPGVYETTITQPTLFKDYLIEQLSLLKDHHDCKIEIGESKLPIPLHFALPADSFLNQQIAIQNVQSFQHYFDVPDLAVINDNIINGEWITAPQQTKPLAPFTAVRIDYSLQRLKHYTGTEPEFFQNFVLFTNYQFYVDKFCELAQGLVDDPNSGFTHFVSPGNHSYPQDGAPVTPTKMPQMPAYHLIKKGHAGITLVNIGVGPSNAKTITDHIAVLRSHAWLMLGHCAGLRSSQQLGDYVLAHAYLRNDHVLDSQLPTWIPIPALAEIQVALETSVATITGLKGWDLKAIMRTGTVASTDNRNWEIEPRALLSQINQSRAIGLDMESATIAANGFRYRVPYGTLLCISDKPLHGELKLANMATEFYKRQVDQHLLIGMEALKQLSQLPKSALHSRKLRGFLECAFQ